MSKVKLSKKYIYKICKEALKEDLYPSGDITSKLSNNTNKVKAKIVSNSSGIIGGLDLILSFRPICRLFSYTNPFPLPF